MIIKYKKEKLEKKFLLQQLLSQYSIIRQLILKLLQLPNNHLCKIDDLIAVCKPLPKMLERNKYAIKQLDLGFEIVQILEQFSQTKKTINRKPYELYLFFKRFSQVIITRIRNSVSSSFQKIMQNPGLLNLFVFIRQLEAFDSHLQNWAKSKKNSLLKQKKFNCQLVLPESGSIDKNRDKGHSEGKTDCQDFNNCRSIPTTAPTTAHLSRKSNDEKISNREMTQIDHRFSEYHQIRTSTLKLEKRTQKCPQRSPSACLTNIRKEKKSNLEYQYKPKIQYSNQVSKDSHSNKKGIAHRVSFQKMFSDTVATKNILNSKKSVHSSSKRVSLISRKEVEQSTTVEQGTLLKKSSTFNRFANKKRHIEQEIILSNEEILNKDILPEQKINQDCRQNAQSSCIFEMRNDKKFNAFSASRPQLNIGQNIESSQNMASSAQIIEQYPEDGNIFFKQKKLNSKVRWSGKFKQNNRQLILQNQGKSTFQNILSNTQHQKIVGIKDQNHRLNNIDKTVNLLKRGNPKTIQYNQDALLASEALKLQAKLTQGQKQTKLGSKNTFHSLYKELNQFWKCYKNEVEHKPIDSVFFEEQQKIRVIENQSLKQKMKQLMIAFNNNNTNVFQIELKETSKKDQKYGSVHRLFSFDSDSEWIKYARTYGDVVAQKGI